jgi:hypothetical protein
LNARKADLKLQLSSLRRIEDPDEQTCAFIDCYAVELIICSIVNNQDVNVDIFRANLEEWRAACVDLLALLERNEGDLLLFGEQMKYYGEIYKSLFPEEESPDDDESDFEPLMRIALPGASNHVHEANVDDEQPRRIYGQGAHDAYDIMERLDNDEEDVRPAPVRYRTERAVQLRRDYELALEEQNEVYSDDESDVDYDELYIREHNMIIDNIDLLLSYVEYLEHIAYGPFNANDIQSIANMTPQEISDYLNDSHIEDSFGDLDNIELLEILKQRDTINFYFGARFIRGERINFNSIVFEFDGRVWNLSE